jgi:hypothetical protein
MVIDALSNTSTAEEVAVPPLAFSQDSICPERDTSGAGV